MPARGRIRLSPFIEGSGADALEAICAAGGEGIVSKRADAPYRGTRSKAWIKAKCVKRAEFVVAGWSDTDKKSRPFSSLLLGSYEDGELVYRGRVGAGFDEKAFDAIWPQLKDGERKTKPFDEEMPSEARGAHWVTPRLVAEVEYTEFTAEGRIRHGVFKGLREDKEAGEVTAKREAETDSGTTATVGGVEITSATREVYPAAHVTKGDVAKHYDAVAEAFLAHAAQRPVSLLRCPEGIEGESFFQKHAGKGFPSSVKSVEIEEKDGETAPYMYLPNAEAVLGAVQMGTLEFHIWGAQRDNIEKPDRMIFDLDPDEGLGFDAVKAAAQEVREGLEHVGLPAGAMVTGGKGVHIVVPLKRTAGWETVKGFAKTFAHILAERSPDRYTATMSKQKRKGRIFIDWLRNERGSTAVAPFSLRAREGAPVAVPVAWEELEQLDRANGFGIGDMAERLKRDDPLAALQDEAQGITKSVVEALDDWSKT